MRGLLALVLLAFASGAAAAGGLPTALLVEVPVPDGPLPSDATGTLPVTVQYCWTGVLLEQVPVDLVVTAAPTWATVALSPPRILLGETVPSGTSSCATGTTTLKWSVTRHAPAFVPEEVRIVATAAGDAVRDAVQAETTTVVVGAWWGRLDVAPPEGFVALERGEARFPLRVTNLGNGNTRVFLEVVDAPEGAEVVLPAPVTLESRVAGGRAIATDLHVYVHDATPGTLVLRATPVYALADLRGPPQDVHVALGGDGGAHGAGVGGLPLPAWTGLVGSLLGLGVWLARPR